MDNMDKAIGTPWGILGPGNDRTDAISITVTSHHASVSSPNVKGKPRGRKAATEPRAHCDHRHCPGSCGRIEHANRGRDDWRNLHKLAWGSGSEQQKRRQLALWFICLFTACGSEENHTLGTAQTEGWVRASHTFSSSSRILAQTVLPKLRERKYLCLPTEFPLL